METSLSGLLRAIFFPPHCAVCQGAISSGVLCEPCRRSAKIARTLFCGDCRARLFGGKNLCHPAFPYLLAAAAEYDNPVFQSLILALKFGRRRAAAEPLSDFIKEYLRSVGNLFEGCIVIPIPLSSRRLRARGFNQAELLARPVANLLELSLDVTALIRIRHTKPQTDTKSAAERRENLRSCFAIARNVSGKNILLVDDVTTTGTTFLEAAQTLKAAGAGTIFALAAAKA